MNSNFPSTVPLPDSVMIFGCGYVGSALARALLESGVRVGALTRNAEKALELRDLGLAEVIEAPLHEAAWIDSLAIDYDGVVNCVSSAGGGLEGYRLSYLEGQKRILEWLGRRASRPVYVYTSSTSVYPQDGGLDVDEEADTTEAPPTGQVLLDSEACLSGAEDQLKNWYVLRLAGIYGPGRHYLLDQLRGGGPIPGRGDYTLNMIHRDDAVQAILQALSGASPSGIYNICDSDPMHKDKVLKYLAGELGLPAPQFDPSACSPRLQRRGGRMPDRVISNQKALQLLDWTPAFPSFREGYGGL